MTIQSYFNDTLENTDPDINGILYKEHKRQCEGLELIASENIVSRAVLQAVGSVMTNKYAEGYPGRRYYGGCEHADAMEQLAQDRAKKLFNAQWVNLQPHSGAQANQSVMLALCKPGDVIMGQSLSAGGHLTHGASVNQSGKWFKPVQYGVKKQDSLIDFDEVRDLAKANNPKLIIAGCSAYPRTIDFATFREIADEVGAILMVDMAHIAGLVAGKMHPNPIEHAHVVTSTTHKTLRGARGGLILSNSLELGKKINSAVFPGLQGGPLLHAMTGKAVCFGEALKPEFKSYAEQMVKNAKQLANTILDGGLELVSGGTDTHLLLVNLTPISVTGDISEVSLERAGLTCNKNGIPFDTQKPMVTSGIRLGVAACTTRGLKEKEFDQIGKWVLTVLKGLQKNGVEGNMQLEQEIHQEIKSFCKKYPLTENPY